MNGEILILSIVKGHSAGVTKAPDAYIENIYFKVMYDKYLCKELMWYSQSKGKDIPVHEMNEMHIRNCINLLITRVGQWKNQSTSVSESIRKAWIYLFGIILEERTEQ